MCGCWWWYDRCSYRFLEYRLQSNNRRDTALRQFWSLPIFFFYFEFEPLRTKKYTIPLTINPREFFTRFLHYPRFFYRVNPGSDFGRARRDSSRVVQRPSQTVTAVTVPSSPSLSMGLRCDGVGWGWEGTDKKKNIHELTRERARGGRR